MKEKLITFAVPCYNSQDYMQRCLRSLMAGGEEVEIIVIDDGSTDRTGEIADCYAEKYPETVRAVHQKNGGHGAGVNKGLSLAAGEYFKVVDSDDWLDEEALKKLLTEIRKRKRQGALADLIICNYLYDHLYEGKQKRMGYENVFRDGKVCTWDTIGKFHPSQYLVMHAQICRTEVLRRSGVRLPRHTFYVDNLFAYQPLSCVDSLIYLYVDLYHYFIGRSDQSVNEQIMISRIDQQLRVTRMMIESTDISFRDVPRRYAYQIKYLTMVLVVSSILLIRAATPEALEKKERLWHMFKQEKPWLYRDVSHTMLGWLIQRDSAAGRRLLSLLYTISQRIFSFN